MYILVRIRILKRIALAFLLFVPIGMLIGCAKTASVPPLFFNVDETIYSLENGVKTPLLQYTDTVLGIAQDDSRLAIYCKTDTQSYIDIYDHTKGSVVSHQQYTIEFPSLFQFYNGEIYCISNPPSTLSCFSPYTLKAKSLPVDHYMMCRDFVICEDCLYTICVEDGEYFLQRYSLFSSEVSEIRFATKDDIWYYFLSGNSIIRVPTGRNLIAEATSDDVVTIWRAIIPETFSDQNLICWERIPILDDVFFSDFDSWSAELVHGWEEYILYETPMRTLEVYHLETSKSYTLWEIPEAQRSTVWEPIYFYSSDSLVAVYSAIGPIVCTASWPDITSLPSNIQ